MVRHKIVTAASKRHLALMVAMAGALAFGACDGDDGAAGKPGESGEAGPPGEGGPSGDSGTGVPTLVKSTPEPAGANCANGGTKIEVGPDTNQNGVLDEDEVISSATSYVCNGTGSSSLVKTSVEPAGTNCTWGGVKIETGLDANGDGVLDDSEVDPNATTYACNTSPTATVVPTKGINVIVGDGDVSTSATGPITVRFQLKDDNGFPVDIAGKFSVNMPFQPRFAIAYFTKDAKGIVSPLKVYTKTTSASQSTPQPTAYTPSTAGHGTLTENGVGAGDYTYTFPTTDTTPGAIAVAYDATKLAETHVVWIQAARQTDLIYTTNADTFYAANESHYFVPDGSGAPLEREITSTASCNKCHNGFEPETATNAPPAFHGGARVEAPFCNVCHNPERVNQAADSSVFVHRIHRGMHIRPANRFHGLAATYPQDIRNCDTCHKDAAQGGQALSVPTRAACGSCHDYVKFDATAAATCAKPRALDAEGFPVDCNHLAGPKTDDTQCATCHNADGIKNNHKPIIPPDPNNLWNGGTNYRTNASYLSAAGYVPTGASEISYDIKSVQAFDDAGTKRPRITFKLKKDGADVVFQTYAAGSVTELMPNFIGSPSVYFAYAVPQEGIAKPADFNVSASGYIKKIWDGTATGSGAGTMTGPDAEGYYTITLTGVQIPASATMLTGGVGYSYDLGSTLANPTGPLTQTNVPGYLLSTDGKKQGGLVIPALNVWKVATGYAGRRPIVEASRCNDCHGRLGVAPTFHVGQRNDGPSCSFCHTANRTSAGWSAGSKYFVHAVHAGRMRSEGFDWHAPQPGHGYGEIEFPSRLNNCQTCHLPNTYDFTGSASKAALPNWSVTTVGTGTYSSTASNSYTFAPYVAQDTAYGSGWSFNAGTGVTTAAAGTTLVISPLTTICSSCHDSKASIAHMEQNGGAFYKPRSSVSAGQEQCMLCHGPGKVAAIGAMHRP
jgi:OmcA/MtrC family decaheme c-type cytochrome